MGKGIPIPVILELLFFISASLIPLALPLAILLSSIMTFGNLAEHNELTALKSSGLSLYRIMRPLMVVVFLIATATFYFANYVIPVANFKWHSIIYDIQNTKISSIITPGVFSKELDGYAIKVKKEKNNHIEDILIYDHTDPTKIKTVRADEGRLYKSVNNKYLFIELINGNQSEELDPEAPTFLPNGQMNNADQQNRRATQTTFKKSTVKIDLSGFKMTRTNEDLFKDQYEMLNVFQMEYAIDSIQKNAQQIQRNFVKSLESNHLYFVAKEYATNLKIPIRTTKKNAFLNPKDSLIQTNQANIAALQPFIIDMDSIDGATKAQFLTTASIQLRQKADILNGQKDFIETLKFSIVQFAISFHKKLALTVAILVLFFVGAPLGAIVRKGGFGAPVVIAALLFMVYFVLISIGESLAKEQVISPFLGMWIATFVLSPFAFMFMIAAANDSPVFRKETYTKLFKRKKNK